MQALPFGVIHCAGAFKYMEDNSKMDGKRNISSPVLLQLSFYNTPSSYAIFSCMRLCPYKQIIHGDEFQLERFL